jgi:RNA recognition motif-containing protein
VKDKLTKKSLGFGFVKFLREDDAIAAIDAKNGFLMGPKKLKVSLARPPSIEIRNCKLYITNLPKEFSEREVTDLFTQVRCNIINFNSSHFVILINDIITTVLFNCI